MTFVPTASNTSMTMFFRKLEMQRKHRGTLALARCQTQVLTMREELELRYLACYGRRKEKAMQAAYDFAGDAGAFVDQTCVDLHQRRAGLEFFVGVGGGENSADADDGEAAFGQVADDFGAAFAEGTAAEAAGLGVSWVFGRRAGDGGVGGDEAIDFAGTGE